MKKANLIASMIRGMKVEEALHVLERLPKKGAQRLYKLLASAASNAENNEKQNKNDLFIKTLIVNKGPSFRRFIPIARGRARRIEKATSHMSVELGIIMPEGEENKIKKEDKKAVKEAKKVEKKQNKKEEKKTDEKVEYSESKPQESFGKQESEAGQNEQKATKESSQSGATFEQHRQGSRGS
ncbi:50S ribosomal protein L22 [Candidatus Peribacteria bacterium]|jgi:large subunit ribosomal protein L22|nr:50S ribosomal protein L22 [Candidatus Peribacteria bacterium]MBT4021384.1 50S ribosomal protein L22 [Candidatus Peribacteria bacterium]MBT4240556.1 50S ribosomal protein L22 [Candidatus Peribacteria bacterium]MBT4474392.1 50S ribosomal protein L22 [Candidatus Peribacteria bacterium]